MEYEFVKFTKCAHIKLIFLNMQQLKIYFTNVFWFLIDGNKQPNKWQEWAEQPPPRCKTFFQKMEYEFEK